jgi:hypothetical protein
MVLLTSDEASFRKTFGAESGLVCESVARVDVLGIWADMVRVTKRQV